MSTEPNFNTFDEIQHKPLQVFNRTIMLNNIYSDLGKEKAAEYVAKFDEGTKKQMYVMSEWIKRYGYESARKASTKGMEFSSEDHEGEPVQ